jgi:hypothetical protein
MWIVYETVSGPRVGMRSIEVLTISRTVQLLKLELPERIVGCLRELRKS